MSGPATHEDVLPLVGLAASDVPHVLAAARLARLRIATAREALAELGVAAGLVPFVLGSTGRLEAHDGSDFDLACVHDESLLPEERARAERERVAGALRARGLRVPDKTFRLPVPIGSLVENIGGARDTNVGLTHRALLLTEGAWLAHGPLAASAMARLFGVYRDGSARGRFMTSLDNDLHRYYRTLCVDYRWKVEEAEADWALRKLKLRHSRKLWHLANLALHCAARGLERRDEHDAWLADRLALPPIVKVSVALDRLGGARSCADLWRRLDSWLEGVSRPELRAALDSLRPEDEDRSPSCRRLKENADALEAAAERVVEILLSSHPSRGHLLRFWLL